jgi:antitoxin ParD1/3/4
MEGDVNKQAIPLGAGALAYAAELVARGDYDDVSAAITGELDRAKALREDEALGLSAVLRSRLSMPVTEWSPVSDVDDLTKAALRHIDRLEQGITPDRP